MAMLQNRKLVLKQVDVERFTLYRKVHNSRGEVICEVYVGTYSGISLAVGKFIEQAKLKRKNKANDERLAL